MVFWLIKDGEKTGPFEDYTLREMIRAGEVTAESKVWHEGADGWMAAATVSILAKEFEKKEAVPPPLPIIIPPFLAWRRLGARVFDFFLYMLILFSAMKLMGLNLIPDPEGEPSLWIFIGNLLPVILMEAALISSLGFTPGKWLLGLRVESILGHKLPTGHGFVRSLRVWILGMGMMQPLLIIIGHAVTLWFGLKKGAPLWDLQGGYCVRGRKIGSVNLVVFWLALAAVLSLTVVLAWPELEPLVAAEMAAQQKK